MTKLTRCSLYKWVWTEPLTVIAKEVGLSDTAVRKTCLRHEIPMPRQGYWQKVGLGQQVPVAPLPDAYDARTSLVVSDVRAEALAAMSVDDLAAVRRRLAEERKPAPRDRNDKPRQHCRRGRQPPSPPRDIESPGLTEPKAPRNSSVPLPVDAHPTPGVAGSGHPPTWQELEALAEQYSRLSSMSALFSGIESSLASLPMPARVLGAYWLVQARERLRELDPLADMLARFQEALAPDTLAAWESELFTTASIGDHQAERDRRT